METALYALTFIPMVLITLIVHEYGHLYAARKMGIITTGFQIGIGPRLWRGRTGRLRIDLTEGAPKPAPGQEVYVWVDEHEDGRSARRTCYRGIEWMTPRRTPWHLPWRRAPWQPLPIADGSITGKYPIFSGKIREVGETHFVMTSMTWSVNLLPMMAMVYIAEDPGERMPGYFNTAPWLARMTVIFSGVAANFVLLLGVMIALALWPAQAASGNGIIEVTGIQEQGPAYEAGIRNGDYLVQINDTLLPTGEQFKEMVNRAHLEDGELKIMLQRDTSQFAVKVRPDPEEGVIGLVFRTAYPESQPQNAGNRFINTADAYFDAITSIFRPGSYSEASESSATPRFSGMITAAHYTAQVVELAKFKAWLAVLGAVTMSVGLVNMLPVPPLDGFAAVLHSYKAVRGGKEQNPLLEKQLTMYGMALILSTIIYLTIKDIQRLT